MKSLTFKSAPAIKGEISVPGDKSVSHRAVMLGAIANGETIINNFLMGEDCLATIDCFRKMGVEIEIRNPYSEIRTMNVIVKGKGLKGLAKPEGILDVGNSGTTIRLISGILAGQDFETAITGDASIQKRPMKRISEPLLRMSARIEGREESEGAGGSGKEIFPPLKITGNKLRPTEYELPVASAQVKSCVLLAGLYADGETTVIEPMASRDHTERMLSYFGADIEIREDSISVRGPADLNGSEVDVPGDISSAAYFLVAGQIVPEADLLIRDAGVNPTRDGIIEVIRRMGGKLEVVNERIMSEEPRADIKIRNPRSEIRKLKGIEIGGELIPRLIDEIPVIAVLATQAKGKTIIKDAKELRVKESDRIKTISSELRKMGAKIEEKEDGMVIEGPVKLNGAKVTSYGDHRVAMALAVAALAAEGETVIENADCVETSFPGFESLLKRTVA